MTIDGRQWLSLSLSPRRGCALRSWSIDQANLVRLAVRNMFRTEPPSTSRRAKSDQTLDGVFLDIGGITLGSECDGIDDRLLLEWLVLWCAVSFITAGDLRWSEIDHEVAGWR